MELYPVKMESSSVLAYSEDSYQIIQPSTFLILLMGRLHREPRSSLHRTQFLCQYENERTSSAGSRIAQECPADWRRESLPGEIAPPLHFKQD